MRCCFGCPVFVLKVVSAQVLFSCLDKRFTAPSVLHGVDRLGREAVVTPGSAHGRESLTLKGAGRVCRQETDISTEQESKRG